jgi:hypothetical protein
MKKIIAMVFVILFLFFQEVFAGGVFMDFKATDEKTENFAKEFILEMEKKKNLEKLEKKKSIKVVVRCGSI